MKSSRTPFSTRMRQRRGVLTKKQAHEEKLQKWYDLFPTFSKKQVASWRGQLMKARNRLSHYKSDVARRILQKRAVNWKNSAVMLKMLEQKDVFDEI